MDPLGAGGFALAAGALYRFFSPKKPNFALKRDGVNRVQGLGLRV